MDNDDVVVTVGLTSGCEARQFDRLLNLQPRQAIVLTASEPTFLKMPTYGEYINVRASVRCLSPPIVDHVPHMADQSPQIIRRCGF